LRRLFDEIPVQLFAPADVVRQLLGAELDALRQPRWRQRGDGADR
jgi:hypothetical protein